MSDEKSQAVTVLKLKQWTATLFSFQVTRPEGFRFTAGQFVRLGVIASQLTYFQRNPTTLTSNEPVFRAYSVVSSPYDEFLEFFSVVIPDGAFTSKLQYLTVGDTLLLNPQSFGFLTLARYQQPAPHDLWLLATGTGIAPFLSILQTLEVWENYQQIKLVYSVRTADELAYQEKIAELKATFGAAGASFQFIPVITRATNDNGLNQRLPHLIANGELENTAGQRFDPITSHVMLCGNPQMVEDTKAALKDKGLTMNRRGEGNIAVENYW